MQSDAPPPRLRLASPGSITCARSESVRCWVHSRLGPFAAGHRLQSERGDPRRSPPIDAQVSVPPGRIISTPAAAPKKPPLMGWGCGYVCVFGMHGACPGLLSVRWACMEAPHHKLSLPPPSHSTPVGMQGAYGPGLCRAHTVLGYAGHIRSRAHTVLGYAGHARCMNFAHAAALIAAWSVTLTP